MTSPTNPGDPNYSDEHNMSPSEAEGYADEAARAQGADSDIDPTVEADVNEALADLEEEEQIQEAAADAQADEAVAAAEGAGFPEESDFEAELAERTEDLQRVSAEYANYRRRTERERDALITNAKASVMTKLLPVLDDLDLARQHGDLSEGPFKSFADKLTSILEGQKLESFGVEGDAFDPEIHEAVQDLSSGDDKAIGTVLRKGYRVGDRVVRTAMVIIADAPSAEASADSAPQE